MNLDDAMDILKGSRKASDVEVTEAKLLIALKLIDNYQSDIRDFGYDKQGFCQGTLYQRLPQLLGDERIAVIPPEECQ